MNRGSAGDLVSRLGVILLGAGALATGCSGTARWEPVPVPVAGIGYEADAGPAACLASAAKTVATQESRGFGLNAGVVLTPLSGVGCVAFTGPSGAARYADVYENGFGFGASIILRRPPAGTVSVGDIYLLGGVEYVSLTGRQYGGSGIDGASLIGIWLDAKTMLSPVGATGALKPYVLCGAGLVRMPGIVVGGTAIGDGGFEPGLRGKLGMEWRGGKLGLYVDLGIQLCAAPAVTDPAYMTGEPLIYTPVGAGAIINF